MKIGFIAPGGFDRGGQERVIPVFLWLVERLARQHEVHVMTLNQYAEPCTYPLLGATVHNIGSLSRPWRGARQASRVMRLVARENRRGRFDVLHGLWATQTGLMAAVAGRALSIPSVVTVAGGELVGLPRIDYGSQLRRRDRTIVACALRLAGAVTCASETMLARVRERRPDARHIVLGVDTAAFYPPPSPPEGPPWTLLHVASLNRVKDQGALLRAFAKITAEEPGAALDIVGHDTLGGEIQRLSASLGLDRSVTFHGFETSACVAARLRQAHLLLHSSLSEAAHMVVLEAAACGVATVGTAVGHTADLAPDAAVATPVGDAEALSRATLELLRAPHRRAAIAKSALSFAREFDADFSACELERLYAAQARRRQPRRAE
jgi:glycosyltransferase involved in cell wall biosynthesis